MALFQLPSSNRSRKSLLYQKGVPSDEAINKIIQDAAAFGETSQHKGHIVRSPLPCRGTLAPLRARVQRLYTKLWKGQAAIHPLPCFFSPCLGCQSWCLGDRFQGSSLHLDFLHSSGLNLLKAGGRERVGAAFSSLPGLVPQEHTAQDYTEGSFVSTWHQN